MKNDEDKIKNTVDKILEGENIRKILFQDGQTLLSEMAQINPRLQTKPPIYVAIVQGGEGIIPHLHVYHDTTLNDKNCSFIRLDKAEHSPHHPIKPLGKIKKAFLAVMQSIWQKYIIELPDKSTRSAYGYEAAIEIWRDTYGDNLSIKFLTNEDGSWKMPDYKSMK